MNAALNTVDYDIRLYTSTKVIIKFITIVQSQLLQKYYIQTSLSSWSRWARRSYLSGRACKTLFDTTARETYINNINMSTNM